MEKIILIDWYNLAMNAFWILGSAVALAALSYASWEASATGDKFSVRLGKPNIQMILNIGGLLFCVGLAGTSDIVWQQVLWGLLGIGFGVQIGAEIYQKRKTVQAGNNAAE